jgi:hypothetical protein
MLSPQLFTFAFVLGFQVLASDKRGLLALEVEVMVMV